MERLREEVGEVGVAAHEGDAEAVRLDSLADVEVATLDVLGTLVMLGVVSLVTLRLPKTSVIYVINILQDSKLHKDIKVDDYPSVYFL